MLLEVIWSNVVPKAGSNSEVTLSHSGIVQGIVDISKDEDSATSLSNLFQCLTTLFGRTLLSSYMHNETQTPWCHSLTKQLSNQTNRYFKNVNFYPSPLYPSLLLTYNIHLQPPSASKRYKHNTKTLCDKIYNKKVQWIQTEIYLKKNGSF